MVDYFAGRLGVSGLDVHVQFVGPAAMRKINHRFRAKDKSTDVLSFPQLEWSVPLMVKRPAASSSKRGRGNFRNKGMTQGTRAGLVAFEHETVLGDMVICLDAAAKNAREDKQDVAREVCFLLAHGMLHLCGHDHQNAREKKVMFSQQQILMDEMGQGWRGCVKRRFR